MIINSQGFGHFTSGINNQDFGIETPKMILILDGCSSGKCSEVGTKLFAQLLSKKKEFDNYEKFEQNVKEVFEDIIAMMRKYFDSEEEFEDGFIMENLLFTILACFETEDKYIVKLLGDGYVITENKYGRISYMRFAYGKCPPYFAYNYCNLGLSHVNFKTYEFCKAVFPKVGIASDGILPIVKGEINGFDNFIIKNNEIMIKTMINNQHTSFYDDVTLGMFEGGKK